jgi:hypothetical protein
MKSSAYYSSAPGREEAAVPPDTTIAPPVWTPPDDLLDALAELLIDAGQEQGASAATQPESE